MAEFLAYRVLDGKLEFHKVPVSLKDEGAVTTKKSHNAKEMY